MWKKLKKDKRRKSVNSQYGVGSFDPKTGQRLDGSGNPIVVTDSMKGGNVDLRKSKDSSSAVRTIEFRKSKIEVLSPITKIPEEETEEVTDTPIRKARVLYEYSPEQEDEIPLKTGQIILVYEEDDSGWWTGECEGKYGLFPGGFVEMIDEDAISSSIVKDIPSNNSQPIKPSHQTSNNDFDMMEDEEFKRIMSGEDKEKKKQTEPKIILPSEMKSKQIKTNGNINDLEKEKELIAKKVDEAKQELKKKDSSLTELKKKLEINTQININTDLPKVQPKEPSPSPPQTLTESETSDYWEKKKQSLEEENEIKKKNKENLQSELNKLKDSMKQIHEAPQLDSLLEEMKKKGEELESRATRAKVLEESNLKLKLEIEKLRKNVIQTENEMDDKLKEIWNQNKKEKVELRELKATIEYESPEFQSLEEANRKLALEVAELKSEIERVPKHQSLEAKYKELKSKADNLKKGLRASTQVKQPADSYEHLLRQDICKLEAQLLDLKTRFETAVEEVEQAIYSDPISILSPRREQQQRHQETENVIEKKEQTIALQSELANLKKKLEREKQLRLNIQQKLNAEMLKGGIKPIGARTQIVNKLGQKPTLRPRKPEPKFTIEQSGGMSFQEKLAWFEYLSKNNSQSKERRRSIEQNFSLITSKALHEPYPSIVLPKIDKNSLRRTKSFRPQEMLICIKRKLENQKVRDDVDHKFSRSPESEATLDEVQQNLLSSTSPTNITTTSSSSSSSSSSTGTRRPAPPSLVIPSTSSLPSISSSIPNYQNTQNTIEQSGTGERPKIPPRPPKSAVNKRSLYARSVMIRKS